MKLKAMLIIGDLLLEQGREKQAIQSYKDLIDLVGSSGSFYIRGAHQGSQRYKENISTPDSVSSKEISTLEEGISTSGENSKLEFSEFLDYTEEVTESEGSIVASDIIEKTNYKDSKDRIVKNTYTRLGDLYKENRNFSEAISVYREAIKYLLEESSAQIRFKIAECLEELEEIDAALKEYLNIPNSYEDDVAWVVKGLLRSAHIYEARENKEEAIEIYRKILNFDAPEAKYAKERIEYLRKVK